MEDSDYMAMMKEKLLEIQRFYRSLELTPYSDIRDCSNLIYRSSH